MAAFADKHYLDHVGGQALDDYLRRGWYRMGQSIFTTHFICFEQDVFPAIWIRLDAAAHTYTKSQRKLMRKNGAQFSSRIVDLELTDEVEQLYERYKKYFKGYIAFSLRDNLYDGGVDNAFDSKAIHIYDGDRLVGFSCFDLGQDSAASIVGIYDPDYHAPSIGYYTMLLEMEYCRANGIRYYYPGYVVPGYVRFDYKLRIGNVEYLDIATSEWRPIDTWLGWENPLDVMYRQLGHLHNVLNGKGIRSRVYAYPLFEALLFGLMPDAYLEYPVVLLLRAPIADDRHYYLVVYDVRSQLYQLLKCAPFDDFRFYFSPNFVQAFDRSKNLVDLVIVTQVLLQTPDAVDFAGMLRKGAVQ